MTWWVDVTSEPGDELSVRRIIQYQSVVFPVPLGDGIVDAQVSPIEETKYGVRIYDGSAKAWTLYPWHRVLAVGKDDE